MFQLLDRSLRFVHAVRDMTGTIEILSKCTRTCTPVLVKHTAICMYTGNCCQPLKSTIFLTKRYWHWLITLCIICRYEKCLGFQIWFVTEFRCEINQSSALPCGQMSYIANKVLILQSKRAYSYIRLLILLTDVYCPPIKLHFWRVSTKQIWRIFSNFITVIPTIKK